MSQIRVLIASEPFPKKCLDILKKEVQVTIVSYLDFEPESLPDIRRQLERGYDALIWNTRHRLTKDLLDIAGPRLRAISTMSSGLNHVDVEEVRKRGILLGNTMQVANDSVADLAVGLMIAAGRRFQEYASQVESGNWKYGVQWKLGRDIAGSTVGIVGLGGIGQAVVQRLKGFNVARFMYCGRTDKPEANALGVDRVPLEQLFKESDFIILTCPLTNETKYMVNTETIKMMKDTVIIVNVGRGDLIDQDALCTALEERRIFAAGTDVTTPEPISKDHPLVTQPNCYILPHIGAATTQARHKMATTAALNVLLALKGKPMRYPVF